MASTPRANIADDAVQGLHCAICAEDALRVVHVERLPDYVECGQCKSAFIMEEGGERVLYGQIAEGYPQTSQFALKQWVWIEAVETRAQAERPTPEDETTEQRETNLEEDWQLYGSQEPGIVDTEEPQSTTNEWSDFDASEPSFEPELAEVDESGKQIEDDQSQDILESPDEQARALDAIDEEDLIDDHVEKPDELAAEPDAPHSMDHSLLFEEEPQSDESEELSGFDWLGGLADEDAALESPDLPPGRQLPESMTAAEEYEDEQSGLSDEDLDDLFKSEDELETEATALADSIAEPDDVDEEVIAIPDWTALEVDQTAAPGEDPRRESDWLEDVDIDKAETSAADVFEPGMSEPELDPELSDDLAQDQIPPEGWLAGRISTGDEQPEAEPSEASLPEEDLPPEDAAGDDFLSSLRDSAAIPLESQPLEDPSLDASDQEEEQPAVPSWALEDEQEEASAMAARMQSVTTDEQVQTPEPAEQEELEIREPTELEPITKDEIDFRETDPPPGFRHRVVISGENVIFPGGECVHCGQTPVKGQLAIAGSLPAGQGMADRKPTRFEVPLCGECRNRATKLSEDAKSARNQSWMFSLIIGLALVVGALAFRLINPADMQLADFVILIILFTIGFAGSAILLLSRISNYPPPLDAAYVRTTLLVPSDAQGLETAFEWRNADYAERFFEANQSNALGGTTQVKDRLVLERS